MTVDKMARGGNDRIKLGSQVRREALRPRMIQSSKRQEGVCEASFS